MVFGEVNRMYEKIKEEIIKHEGKINKIYKDHLGNATFGVGHLVLPTDDLQEADIKQWIKKYITLMNEKD